MKIKFIIGLLVLMFLLGNLLFFGIILSSNNKIVEEEIGEEEIRLSFVGDIMTSRTVLKKINWFGVKTPFKYLKEHLSNSDISFGNFEGTISDKEGIQWKKCCEFKSPSKIVNGLVWSGIDIISITNNHMMDYGPEVYQDTIDNLENFGIRTIGANYNSGYSNSQDFKIIEVKGKKIGFLGYYDNEYNKWYIHDAKWFPQPLVYKEEFFLEDIENAKEQVDILVVSIHWGEEYEVFHNDRQEDIGHLAIDNGANIVIGHHSHVVQEIEEYHKGIIAYSLGNFVSDQPTSLTPEGNKDKTKESIVLDVYVDKENNLNYKINEIKIVNRCQPRLI